MPYDNSESQMENILHITNNFLFEETQQKRIDESEEFDSDDEVQENETLNELLEKLEELANSWEWKRCIRESQEVGFGYELAYNEAADKLRELVKEFSEDRSEEEGILNE